MPTPDNDGEKIEKACAEHVRWYYREYYRKNKDRRSLINARSYARCMAKKTPEEKAAFLAKRRELYRRRKMKAE